jgi:hypothetical protein
VIDAIGVKIGDCKRLCKHSVFPHKDCACRKKLTNWSGDARADQVVHKPKISACFSFRCGLNSKATRQVRDGVMAGWAA